MSSYLTTLHLTAIGGTATLWVRAVLDGTVPAIFTALHGSEQYVLPGTHDVLRTQITGIRWPIDYLLNVLVVFFWEAVDGSHPTTSAIGIYFLTQYFAILAVFLMESGRSSARNSDWMRSKTLWMLIFQATGVGCAGPIWAILHFKTSPFFRASNYGELRQLVAIPSTTAYAIPGALVLGYALPAILMSLKSPEAVSNGFQQSAIVVWNTCPLWIVCCQTILEHLLASLKKPTSPTRLNRQSMTGVRVVSSIAIMVAFMGHVSLLALATFATLFPTVVAPGYRGAFSFSQLLLPPITWEKVQTVGDGVRAFFLWDQWFGYTAMLLLWGARLHQVVSLQNRRYRRMALFIGLMCFLTLGPGCTCVLLVWIGDELLCENIAPEPVQAEKLSH